MKERKMLGFCFLAAAVLAVASADKGGDVTPKHYTLSFDFTGKDPDSYSGSVGIKLTTNKVMANRLMFTLNSTNLGVKLSNVEVLELSYYPKEMASVKSKEGLVEVQFLTPLYPNLEYTININFTGKFDKEGIYYAGDIIYSNFFLENAQNVFPCFEESSLMKTTFDLALTHSSDWAAYSYTSKPMRQSTSKTTVKTIFSTSPLLSIRNLGFVLVKNYNNVQVNRGVVLLAPKESPIEASIYLLECATLDPFKEMYDMTEKSDLYVVSVPSLPQVTFNSHNIVFMKSSYMNFDYEMTTSDRAHYCLMVLKSIAKNFYGAILTPTDWNQRLTYEAIPNYLQLHAFSQMGKLWGDLFITDIITEQFDLGVEENTLIEPKRDSLEKFELAQFTDSSARKGASFLTMMDAWMKHEGKGRIYDVITNIFKEKLKDGRVQTMDFLKYLSKKMNVPVDDLTYWLETSDYPVLKAEINSDNNVVTVSLRNTTRKWVVPVAYQVKGKELSYAIVNSTNPILLTVSPNDWVLLNADGSGLYRVEYAPTLWSRLGQNPTAYQNVMTKTRLYSDAFWMGKDYYNDSSYEATLQVLNHLADERSYAPWSTALRGFYYLRNLYWNLPALGKEPMKNVLELKTLEMLKDIYNNVGTNVTSVARDVVEDNMIRRLILAAYCDFGNTDCKSTLGKYEKNLESGNAEPQEFGYDSLPAINCVGMEGIDCNSEWFKYEPLYNVNYTAIKKKRVFDQLACSPCASKFLIKMTTMPDEDIQLAFESLSSRSKNIQGILDYFKENIVSWKARAVVLASVMRKLGDQLYDSTQGTDLTVLEGKLECATTQTENLIYCKAVKDAQNDLKYNLAIQNLQENGLRKWCSSKVTPTKLSKLKTT